MTKKLKNNWLNSGIACLLLGAATIPGQMLVSTTLYAMDAQKEKDAQPLESLGVVKQILELGEKKEYSDWKYEKIALSLENKEKVNNLGCALKKGNEKLGIQEMLNEFLRLIGKGNRDDLAKGVAQNIKQLMEDMATDAQMSLKEEFLVKRILKNHYTMGFLFDLAAQSISYDIVRVDLLKKMDEEDIIKKASAKQQLDESSQDRDKLINAANLTYTDAESKAAEKFEQLKKEKEALIERLEADNGTMTGVFKPTRYSENLSAIKLAKEAITTAKTAKETTIKLAQETKDQEILKARESFLHAETSYKLVVQQLDAELYKEKKELEKLYVSIFTPLGFSYGAKWTTGYDRTALDYNHFDKIIAESHNKIKEHAYEIIFDALIKEYGKASNEIVGVPTELLHLLKLDESALKVYRLQEKKIRAQLQVILEEKQKKELELTSKETQSQPKVQQQVDKVNESAQKKSPKITSEDQNLPILELQKDEEGIQPEAIFEEKKKDVLSNDHLVSGMNILQESSNNLKKSLREAYFDKSDDESFSSNIWTQVETKSVVSLLNGRNTKKKNNTSSRSISSNAGRGGVSKSTLRNRRSRTPQGTNYHNH